MNVFFYTMGCKVNQYESQLLSERFEALGHKITSAKDAEVIIVNSCSVTAESDRKARQALRRFRRETEAIIVLTGCISQAGGKVDGLADIITGNNDYDSLVEKIEQFVKDRKTKTFITPHKNGEAFASCRISRFSEHTRAFIKIEDGCDNFCTYCIIPYSRGRVRSKCPADVKAEAELLAKNGYCEIVLIGINLCNYGKGEEYALCDAVYAAAEVDGIKRIRLGSLEPDHIGDSDLKRLAECKKFCPNFHLSLQSGCSATLKRMNRHYDAGYYKNLVEKIRKNFKYVSITTDIMCGFPGETDREFAQSLEFFKNIGFARAHVFAYSRRPGTVADKAPNQIPENIKKQRSRILGAAAAEAEKAYMNSIIGQTRSVLFETEKNGMLHGYTDDYIRVCMPYTDGILSTICDVIITKTDGFCCICEKI